MAKRPTQDHSAATYEAQFVSQNASPKKRRAMPPKAPSRQRSVVKTLATTVFLSLLGAAALGVIFVLPGHLEERQLTPAKPASTTSPEAVPATGQAPSVAEAELVEAEFVEAEFVETGLAEAELATVTSTMSEPESTTSTSFETAGTEQRPAAPASTRASLRAQKSPTPDAFSRAMSEGLESLAAGRFEDARQALEAARLTTASGAEPSESSLRALEEALARVEYEQRTADIEQSLERAANLEATESWSEAVAAYEHVLSLDPHLVEARERLANAQSQTALATDLRTLLAQPARLSSNSVLEQARLVLERARHIDASPASGTHPGSGKPKRHRQVAELTALVKAYATPVNAELVSDGATDVTIYRVGRLGNFERRVLELRPGSYTVIGSRPGFRDVREEWTITPGETPPALTVRCEEAL